MKKQRALVISDDQSRKEYLFNELKKLGFFPVWYPNIFAYQKAVEIDEIKVIVADLSMPIEPKLDIISRGLKKQPRPKLITIGKYEYLKSNNLLDSSVIVLKSIEEIPSVLNS